MFGRNWRTTSLWKKTFVCSALLLLVAVNVQAVANESYCDQDDDEYREAVAVQLNTEYSWIHSGRELFYTKIGGQTRFVGIQAMMRVPLKIETGRYYSVPVYFTRFVPQIPIKPTEQLITNKDIAIQKRPLPIDVFICAGIGVHSSKISTASHSYRDCFHIGIGISDGDLWTHNIPIVSVEPVTDSKQYVYTGYDQKIWINQPEYRYLTDIPVGTWDGPYMVNVKIDVISYLPPSIVAPSKEYIPPPVPLAEYQLEAKVVPLAEEAVKILSVVDEDDLPELSKYAEKSQLKSIKTVELKEVNDKQVYQVKGVKEAKLLWVIPVDMEITVNINMDTGAIENMEKPWWGFLAT